MQGKACTGWYAAASRHVLPTSCCSRLRAGPGLRSCPPVNKPWQSTAGVPLASVTHQGQAITYIAVPTGPSQINPQMQHALMKHAIASGLPSLQEQHGHTLKFEGGSEQAGQAAAHAAAHAAGQYHQVCRHLKLISTSLGASCSMCRPG